MADDRSDALLTAGSFSRAQARAAGVPVSELLGSSYRRLFFDQYVRATAPITLQVQVRAALGIAPEGSYASHHTAAKLHGGIVTDHPDLHISVPSGGYRPRRDGITAHLANSSAEVVVHKGLPCSSPAQSVLDLSPGLGLVDLVVLGDSLVRAGAVTPQDLITAADAWRGHGAKLARRAMRLVRSGVDSPMETRLRLLLVLAGYPEPVVDLHIHDEARVLRARLDLSYPRWKVAVEYEGRHHAESPAQWTKDIDRREFLDIERWRLVVVKADGVYGGAARTLDRVEAALRAAGATGLGPRTDRWRRYFPGRGA